MSLVRLPHFTLRLVAVAPGLLLGACMNLTGLGGESKYACAAPEGVTCQSVAGTYANAVRGKTVDRASTDRPAATLPTVSPDPRGVRDPGGRALPDSTPSQELRSQGRVLRLWIKPWEDIDGDLWDQGYVYVQVSGGAWQLDHVRQRVRDRYTPLRPPSSVPTNTSTPAEPVAPIDPGPSGAGAQTSAFPLLQTPAGRVQRQP